MSFFFKYQITQMKKNHLKSPFTMASFFQTLSVYYFCTILFINISYLDLVLCFNTRNLTLDSNHWKPAGATWYGSPTGAGSEGGNCGYGDAVSKPPFSSLIAAVGPSLYGEGKECGACYQVKCSTHKSCSRKPVRVVVTDNCPGGPCAEGPAHFDLSGTAFGAMAIPGQEDNLRNAGVLNIKYARVPCDYPGQTIIFNVDQGANPYYLAFVVEYEDGDGDLATVHIKESNGNGEWKEMKQSWGAVWKLDAGYQLQPPISIQLTSGYSSKTLVAENVIPNGWQPGGTYRSVVNF